MAEKKVDSDSGRGGDQLGTLLPSPGRGGEGRWGQMVGVWKAEQRGLNLSWLHYSETWPQ